MHDVSCYYHMWSKTLKQTVYIIELARHCFIPYYIPYHDVRRWDL